MNLLPESPYINFYKEWLQPAQTGGCPDPVHAYSQHMIGAYQRWVKPIEDKLQRYKQESVLTDAEMAQRFFRETKREIVAGHLQMTLIIWWRCHQDDCEMNGLHKWAESVLRV